MSAEQEGLWRIGPTAGHLQATFLSADVPLLAPSEGLTNVRLQGHLLPKSQLLGIDLPGFSSRVPANMLGETYQRRHDLVAAYSESPASRIRPTIYWRYWQADVGLPAAADGPIAGVQVLLSVQTTSLDVRPVLHVGSRMVGQELWQFCADSSSWRPAARDADPHARILRVADLWLLRLAGEGPLAHWSCAEMVYPADVRSAHVAYDHSTGTWRTRHRLLDEHLEKGVIRRLRCAVVWLPRKHDLQLAETLYERFLNAPLPLTT